VRYVIAVDPGDRHVGLAIWAEGYWWTEEVDADEAATVVDGKLYDIGGGRTAMTLVLEEFRLYPDKAGAQAYSPMETAQMIGALKWIAKERGAQVVEQGAGIKKATRAQLGARGIKLVGTGSHARDAELHLVHFLLKEKIWSP